MNIAFIGAGKLGFPVGCATAARGHWVTFYDTNRALISAYQQGILPPTETGLPEAHKAARNRLLYADTVEQAVGDADLIFIAVPTPHLPEQDGSRRFRNVRANFDNTYVEKALAEVIEACQPYGKKTIVVISTMLPGSMDRLSPDPEIDEGHTVLYSPSFIAMGTVVDDFENPEFWLIGTRPEDGPVAAKPLIDFYRTVNSKVPVHVMSWSSAEATKVFYNTAITMKITLANMMAQIADQIPGCDIVHITEALKTATRRICSPAYMGPGMVDGGGCHPRDNIALSWLSDDLEMNYNLFDYMMMVRECQVEYLAKLIAFERTREQTVVILGKAYKEGTHLTYGSPSLLLADILAEQKIPAVFYDVFTDPAIPHVKEAIYVYAVPDSLYASFPFQPGSIVIDPWCKLTDNDTLGCKLISVGRR